MISILNEGGAISPGQEELLKEAGEVLKRGGLVAFPTETVYGLGGDALNAASSKKIYAAKGRPSDNPLIVHICRMEDLYAIAEVNEVAERIAEAFWPGPLTMILPRKDVVPRETTGGLDTVAVRMPSHPVAAKLIAYAGGYVAAPSANRSGRPSPTVAKYVREDMEGRIEMIIDGGEVGIGLESTILDLTVSPPQILRPGYITEQMLESVLDKVDTDVTIMSADSGQAPKAPGMKYRHYAPKGELTIVTGKPQRVVAYINEQIRAYEESVIQQTGGAGAAGAEILRTGVIAAEQTCSLYRADVVKCIGSRQDEQAIARHLYRVLREMDDEGVTCIYSESFAEEGFGQAIMNRLLKAAGHRVVKV